MSIDRALVVPAGTGKAIWSPGFLVTFKAAGDQTGGSYAMLEFTIAPNFPGLPMHIHHNEDEAFYILDGTLQIQIAAQTIVAETGAFVLQPRGIAHTFSNPTDAPVRMLAINSPPGFEQYMEELGDPAKERTLPPPMSGPIDMEQRLALMQRYNIELAR